MNLFGKKAAMMLGIAAASAMVFSASAQQQRPNYEGKPAFAGQTRAPLAKKAQDMNLPISLLVLTDLGRWPICRMAI